MGALTPPALRRQPEVGTTLFCRASSASDTRLERNSTKPPQGRLAGTSMQAAERSQEGAAVSGRMWELTPLRCVPFFAAYLAQR